MSPRLLRPASGFTLIELLVVILIIGILVAVSAPSFLGQTEKAHDSAAKQYLAVAYREAKAVSTDHEGNFTTTGFDATTLASAIDASEPALDVVAGSCPVDTTGEPTHIVIDTAATSGDSLELCNDPNHTVWFLTVTAGGAPSYHSQVVALGVQAPVAQGASEPTISGTAEVGQQLVASSGGWNNSPTTFSYQWRHSSDSGQSWTAASGVGAATATYTVDASDVGDVLRVDVTASNAAGSAVASSQPTATVPQPSISLSFAAPTTYGETFSFSSGTVTDVNGDNKPDLLALSPASNRGLGVMLGSGSGSLGAPSWYYKNTNALAYGDFNGDGKLDAAQMSGTSNPLFYWTTGNGDGTFGAWTSSATTDMFSGVLVKFLVGNFNGRDDVIGIDGAHPFFYAYNGSSWSGSSSLGNQLQATVSGATTGDFNGDGKLDFALSSSSKVAVYSGNGAGGFSASPATSFPTGGTISAADLNGDGKDDLLLSGSATITPFLSNGDGTFSAGAAAAVGCSEISSSKPALADFNLDGHLDVAVPCTTGPVVLLGNGDGSLQAGVAFSGISGRTVFFNASGDLNGDGKPDILVGTDYRVYVYLNNGS